MARGRNAAAHNLRSPLAALSLCVVLAAGCATQAQQQSMVATDFTAAHKHPQTVSVSVTGGQETSALGKSQISNESFAQALAESINRSQAFSKVLPTPGGTYLLSVQVFNVEQPSFGATFTVKMETGWTLKRADSGKTVWQQAIRSEHSVSVGEAFVGAERLRLANEGAARKNIAAGLAEITKLDF